jgi:TPR repeat protein
MLAMVFCSPVWAQAEAPVYGAEATISTPSNQSDALLRLGDYYSDGIAVPVDYARAFDFYHQAAESGRAGGTLRMAEMLIAGQGVDSDVPKGLAMLETLAGDDYPAALVRLGEIYIAGIPGHVDAEPEKALALLRRAADGGDATAVMLFGDALVRVRGATADAQEVLSAYQRAADLGRTDALLRIGDFWTEGALVPVDLAKGYAAYERAAAAGSSSAVLRVAEMLARGQGANADPAAGLERVRQQASAGDGTALLLLAELLASGAVGPIDGPGAVAALEAAAAAGRPEALLRLGEIYRDGLVVPADGERAATYLEQAAAAGQDFARYLLGRALTEERINRPDGQALGLAMLEQALTDGVEEAAIGLANAHLYGYGRRQDPAAGLALLEEEAEAGNLAAVRRLLALFRDGSRDGDTVLVAPDAERAEAYLAMLAPTLGRSDLLVETLLLEAAAMRDGNYQFIADRIGELPPDDQASLLRNLVGVAPNGFVYLVQGQLQALGLYSGPRHGQLTQATISAMLRLCDLKQVGDLCRRGPLTSQSAQILSYAF